MEESERIDPKTGLKTPSSLLNYFGLGFLALGIFLVLFISSKKKSSVEIIENPKDEAGEVVVHIEGAVEKPGVYKLKTDSRLNDLLVASGGLSEGADRQWFSKNINLAQKVTDGIKIYIPFASEVVSGGKVADTASENNYEKININFATSGELETVLDIGPSLAKKIITYREENGLFKTIEDVMQVPGIGPKTFEKIKNKIAI